MLDIEVIKNASPIEDMLCQMIETPHFTVLIDENGIEEENIDIILEALILYSREVNTDFSVRFIGGTLKSEYSLYMIKVYELEKYIEFVDESDADRLLTLFLASDALIMMNKINHQLASDLYLTQLMLRDDCEPHFEDGIFVIPKTAESLCAGLMMVRERKYSDVLTGHKRLY